MIRKKNTINYVTRLTCLAFYFVAITGSYALAHKSKQESNLEQQFDTNTELYYTLYTILNVDKDTLNSNEKKKRKKENKKLNETYQDFVVKHHPSRIHHPDKEANKKFKQARVDRFEIILKAYTILSNPQHQEIYFNWLEKKIALDGQCQAIEDAQIRRKLWLEAILLAWQLEQDAIKNATKNTGKQKNSDSLATVPLYQNLNIKMRAPFYHQRKIIRFK